MLAELVAIAHVVVAEHPPFDLDVFAELVAELESQHARHRRAQLEPASMDH